MTAHTCRYLHLHDDKRSPIFGTMVISGDNPVTLPPFFFFFCFYLSISAGHVQSSSFNRSTILYPTHNMSSSHEIRHRFHHERIYRYRCSQDEQMERGFLVVILKTMIVVVITWLHQRQVHKNHHKSFLCDLWWSIGGSKVNDTPSLYPIPVTMAMDWSKCWLVDSYRGRNADFDTTVLTTTGPRDRPGSFLQTQPASNE